MRLPPALDALLDGWTRTPVLKGESGGNIFRLTDTDGRVRFLKCGTGAVAEDIADEAHRLFWLAGRMPCAEPLHFTRSVDGAWLLTDAVAGRTVDAWIEDDRAHLPMVIDAMAAFLRRLHALPVADCPFDAGADVRMAHARRLIDADMVDTDDFDSDHDGWIAEQLWDRLVALRRCVRPCAVTHGDYSLGNVMIDEGGRVMGCIDVGRLGVADPYQDIAILWQNLREFGEGWAARFLDAYGLEVVDWQQLEFHRCLDELF
jgi:aminoglycoside 3'-phosphotransferase I